MQCGVAWEKFSEGYSIAKPPLIGGDLGNSRVEVCSTGFDIVYFNLNWLFLRSVVWLRNIPPWFLFLFFSLDHWKLPVIFASHYSDTEIIDLKMGA